MCSDCDCVFFIVLDNEGPLTPFSSKLVYRILGLILMNHETVIEAREVSFHLFHVYSILVHIVVLFVHTVIKVGNRC